MTGRIQQPSNQIKLTNVSLVRLKKGKKRFEIACYKNKVLEWRSGIEKDLDNVLQIPNVFTNVSKGQVAPQAELAKAFGKDAKTDDVVLEILNKGELQVGEKERAAELERKHIEVLQLVAAKLVDPRTKRVYTTSMIEKVLDQLSLHAHDHTHHPKDHKDKDKDKTGSAATAAAPAGEDGEAAPVAPAPPKPQWTGVVTTKSAKSQALDAMKALIAHQPIPLQRARMRLRVTCSTNVLKLGVKAPKTEEAKAEDGDDGQPKAARTVKEKILSYIEQVENQDVIGSQWEVTGFAEPGALKPLSEFISNETKGQGQVEVLDMAVVYED